MLLFRFAYWGGAVVIMLLWNIDSLLRRSGAQQNGISATLTRIADRLDTLEPRNGSQS